MDYPRRRTGGGFGLQVLTYLPCAEVNKRRNSPEIIPTYTIGRRRELLITYPMEIEIIVSKNKCMHSTDAPFLPILDLLFLLIHSTDGTLLAHRQKRHPGRLHENRSRASLPLWHSSPAYGYFNLRVTTRLCECQFKHMYTKEKRGSRRR